MSTKMRTMVNIIVTNGIFALIVFAIRGLILLAMNPEGTYKGMAGFFEMVSKINRYEIFEDISLVIAIILIVGSIAVDVICVKVRSGYYLEEES